MKLMTLILSLLFFTGCETAINLPDFPDQHLFTPDIVNQLCVEYAIADRTKITFQLVAKHPLAAGGPCDHMRGFTATGFKQVQNWTRDVISIVNSSQQ